MSIIKSNFFYQSLLSVSGILLPLVTFPYITRTIGPVGYGTVAFVNSFIQYFIIISTLGIPFYGTREVAKVKDNIEIRSKLFFEIFFIHQLLTIIVVLVYIFLIFSIKELLENKIYFIWGVIYILCYPLNIQWYFSGLEKFKFIALRSIILNIVQVILLFVFVKSSNDTFSYFILPIIFALLTIFINLKYVLKFLDFKSVSFNFKNHFKPIFYLFLFNFFVTIYELVDSVILGFLTDYKTLSYYAASMRLIKVPITLFYSLTMVLIPRISTNLGDVLEVKRLTEKSLSFIFFLAIPIMIGELVLAPEIMMVLAGINFAPAISTFRILSILTVVISVSAIFGLQILNTMGKDRELVISAIISAFSFLILSLFLIPIWRNDGAAVANVFAELVSCALTLFFARKFLAFQTKFRLLIMNIAISLPFILVALIFRNLFSSPLIILVSTISISASYYFLIHYFVFKTEFLTDILHLNTFKESFLVNK